MISFANPLFLWALTGLTIPLAIHLLSRKEGKVIYVGSLRHLQESSTRQSLSIQLNELLLLLLRLLLFALLVLLISGLQWLPESNPVKKWVLMEKGLEKDKQLMQSVDSLEQNGYESHYLAPGFPLLKDSTDIPTVKNYGDLVSSLESGTLTDAIVFSYSRTELFRGRRISLPSNIHWITRETSPLNYPVRAVRIRKDSLRVRVAHSNLEETFFETTKVSNRTSKDYFQMAGFSDSTRVSAQDSLHILLVADAEFLQDQAILRAALATLQETLSTTAIIVETKQTSKAYDLIIQLSSKANEQINKSANQQICFKENLSSPLLVQSSPQQWLLTKRLNEGVALKENLPIRLCEILFPGLAEWQVVHKYDRRSTGESQSWSKRLTKNEASTAALIPRRSDSFLLLTILFILVIERVISHYRNQ